jgi:hypothetical protein
LKLYILCPWRGCPVQKKEEWKKSSATVLADFSVTEEECTSSYIVKISHQRSLEIIKFTHEKI